jgi:hypothetical protein
MRRTTQRAGIVALALLALVAACRQLVGIGDAPPTALADAATAAEATAAEAGPRCGIAYEGTQCEACLETSCCDYATACSGDTSCSLLEGCYSSCQGDVTCRAGCTYGRLIGPNPYEETFAACLVKSCAAPCGLECGGAAEIFGVDAAAGCQECMTAQPCSVLAACASDPSCQTRVWCNISTPRPDRSQACFAAIDGGADAYAAGVDSFLSAGCSSECQGEQWYCLKDLGNPQFVPSTTMTYRLGDALSGDPVAGASVTVCGQSLLLDCDASADAPTTDDAGTAMVPLPGAGPTGYLSVSGQGLYPQLTFWGFPLSEPTYSYSGSIFSRTGVTSLASATAAQVGVNIDTVGHAFIEVGVIDCRGNGARGVTLSLDPPDSGAQLIYINTGVPTLSGPTDGTGEAVFVNVPAGVFTVTATPVALGHASSVLPVKTMTGTETVVTLVPNQ